MVVRWAVAALIGLWNLSTVATAAERLRVVVHELDANGVSPQVARVVSEQLRSKLIETRRFVVPEREKMEAVVAEQSVSLSLLACSSQECAIELGRILQANKMVVGSVSLLNQTYSINTRFLDLETGAAEFSAEEKCQTADDLFLAAERLAARIAASVPQRGTVTAVSGENIIIDLGALDGVSTGMQFRVLRRVERVQGYWEEEQVALAVVTSVQPTWSRIEPQRAGLNFMRPVSIQQNDIVVGVQSITVDELPRYAFLSVYSRPVGAEVYVDNLFQGRAPESGLEVRLTPGKHTVRVSAPAHRTEERSVELRPDERRSFNATLQPRLRRIPFRMQVLTGGYVQDRPANSAFRSRLENERMNGARVGIGRVYSVFMSEAGGSWTHANIPADRSFGLNEVHNLSLHAQGGISPRLGWVLPYVAFGYELSRFYFNDQNVFEGQQSLGDAGKVGNSGWYWGGGAFLGHWFHVGFRQTIGRPETDFRSLTIGVNLAGF